MSTIAVSKPKSNRLSKTGRRLACLVGAILWTTLLTKILVFDVDVYLVQRFAPQYEWILDYRVVGFLVVVLASIALSWIPRVREGLVYVVCFPLCVLLLFIPLFVWRNWALAISFAPVVQSITQNFRRVFFWYSAYLLAVIMIFITNNSYVLWSAIITIGCFLIRHYSLEFRRTFQPSSVFADLTGLVKKMNGGLVKAFFNKEKKFQKPLTKEDERKHQTELQILYIIHSCLQLAAERFRDVAKSRKLDLYFIASLTYTFALTVFSFSFAYLALYGISPAGFSPSDGVNYFHFLGKSFSMATAANLSGIILVGDWSLAIGYFQVFTMLFFGVIVVNFLLASARDRYREDLDLVIAELRSGVDLITSQMVENFQLTYDDLENLLIEESRALVNSLRSARGLPVLAPPAKPKAQTAGEVAGPIPNTEPGNATIVPSESNNGLSTDSAIKVDDDAIDAEFEVKS